MIYCHIYSVFQFGKLNNDLNRSTLNMFYKGQSKRDARQKFEKNKGH